MKTRLMGSVCCAMAALLLLTSETYAQYTMIPDLQVSTDRPSYVQFEPVLLEISLTNPSSEPQSFGAPGLLKPLSNLSYRVTGPAGTELSLHTMFFDIILTGNSPAYLPGETRTATYNLLIFYPIAQQPGTYTVEVGFPIDASDPDGAQETVSTSFAVQAPAGVDSQVIEALARAKRALRDLEEFGFTPDTTIADNLDFVLNTSGLPSHMMELVLYLRGLHKEVQYSFDGDPATLQEARQRYAEFLDQYPNSVYAFEAQFGFTVGLGSLEELAALASPPGSSLPDLPGALTLASDDVSASFSGNAFALNGNDHTLSGQPNPSGDDAHGIFTTTAVSQQSLLDALKNNQRDNITGSGPDPDIAQDDLAFDPTALIDALLALVTETLTTSPGGTLGSPEAPVVAYAPDGLTLTGNLDGTGVLIVDGSYAQHGSVQWTGLVVVRADDDVPPSFEMRGNVGVTGGVLILNETNQAARLEVTGSAEVRYSREVFEMLRAALFPNP